MRRYLKRISIFFSICILIALTVIWYCDSSITSAAETKLFSNSDSIPQKHCGLVLGTSKYLRDGLSINPYYKYRLDATVELMQKNRIKYLIISGDNSRKTYSEPEDMRNDLIEMGIDSNRIFLDYAGFRTFDSVIRLKKIFSQNDICFISQKFHNERALFIAEKEGIKAVAFNAKDVSKSFGFKVMLREKLARVKVFVDYLSSAKPKFLGPKVIIPEN